MIIIIRARKYLVSVLIFTILLSTSVFSQVKDEKKIEKSKVVDPVKLWKRVTGAIAATRYPYLNVTEDSWPSCYKTIVNAWENNYGLDGPEGTGFIYPGIVILDCEDNIKEIAMIEMASTVNEQRSHIWKFLSSLRNKNGTTPDFSIYVPVVAKDKAAALIKSESIVNFKLHAYRIKKGYLEVDGELVHHAIDGMKEKEKYLAPLPDSLKVSTNAQLYRVFRINATTGYPYFDQADNSWDPAFREAIVNDEVKRLGLPGPGDMGIIYPSVLIVDTLDRIRLIGLMEPPENVTEERAKVWEFLSNSLDYGKYKFLYIHVPHGLEDKAFDILKRNNIKYSGLRGYSIGEDGKLLIWLRYTNIAEDNR
jgi:hypothetical protein